MNMKRRGFFRTALGALSMLPFFGRAKAGLPPEFAGETPTILVDSPIFRGEVPFLTLNLNDAEGNPVPVGKLWGKGGKFSFTGDVDESARMGRLRD